MVSEIRLRRRAHCSLRHQGNVTEVSRHIVALPGDQPNIHVGLFRDVLGDGLLPCHTGRAICHQQGGRKPKLQSKSMLDNYTLYI